MQAISDFIERWESSGGSERANYALFLTEFAEVLGVEKPLPVTATSENDHYRLERPVASGIAGEGAKKFIDLYRRGSFILETKQGTQGKVSDPDQLTLPDVPQVKRVGHGVRGTRAWDKMMVKARGQADNYARGIAREDGWPPFLIVCDVGYVFEIYSDFSGQGHGYTQFPDGKSFRIFLQDLEDPRIQDLFRAIWNDPQSLDPSKRSAKVTREIADQLALLGRSFEKQGHEPDRVAAFLMRCLFSMFAEDVDLLPRRSFEDLLISMLDTPDAAAPMLKELWSKMDTGDFSTALRAKVLKFNGGLFADAEALPLDSQQIALLIGAAKKDWQTVEPAIFGTLLERALDKRQRHKLGAHYTPRAYVERLVLPTVIEPLRADWDAVRASAYTLADQGDMKKARDTVHAFHRKLSDTRVLDPACGSGNFLYVALEMMKRLEGEVTNLLEELGEEQTALSLASFTVDPHNFLGIELNPWAARVAELVLWIGYLQWHFRTYGKAAPSEPVLRDFHNIEHRDAVLDWADKTPRMDGDGAPVTRWDGVSTITHNVTGKEVPDPEARVQVYDYAKPAPAKWPEADFIVGNPPFIGKLKMRKYLGDGYVEALRVAYPKIPDSADFVMYWWHKSAVCTQRYKKQAGKGTRRAGLITTKTISQTFNVRVIQAYLVDPQKPISILFAIPDHPWLDTLMSAKVDIAMTVFASGRRTGRLLSVQSKQNSEIPDEGYKVSFSEERGHLRPKLTIGADLLEALPLSANEGLCSMGFALGSQGFVIPKLVQNSASSLERSLVKPMLAPDSFSGTRKVKQVFDGWTVGSEDELRTDFPVIYQHLRDTVWPSRKENNDPKLVAEWWRFRRANTTYRTLKSGLGRFLATKETSMHRTFQFENKRFDLEHGGIAIGVSDAWILSVCHSSIHRVWGLSQGGDLGVAPRYNKSRCFDPFPFPVLTDPQRDHLRALGEELDTHRKTRQAEHPKLTLTQMYNVLEKVRAGDPIEGKDRKIYEQGLIAILKDLHDQIDAAVADAYGWPADLADEDILFRLVALNKERAEEEAQGNIRWLRPDYQNPTGAQAAAKGKQSEMEMGVADSKDKPAWPKAMPDQVAALRDALQTLGEGTPDQLGRTFKGRRGAKVEPLLESLVALGLAARTESGNYRPTR